MDLPLRVERHIITALDTPGTARDVLPFCWCDDINMSYGRPEGPDLVLFGSWSGGGMSFRNDEAPEAEEITNPDVYRAESDAAEGAEILAHARTVADANAACASNCKTGAHARLEARLP